MRSGLYATEFSLFLWIKRDGSDMATTNWCWDIHFSDDTPSQSKRATSSGAKNREKAGAGRACLGPTVRKVELESPTRCLPRPFSKSCDLMWSSLRAVTQICMMGVLWLWQLQWFHKVGLHVPSRHLHLVLFLGVMYSAIVSPGLGRLLSHSYPSVLLVIKQTDSPNAKWKDRNPPKIPEWLQGELRWHTWKKRPTSHLKAILMF